MTRVTQRSVQGDRTWECESHRVDIGDGYITFREAGTRNLIRLNGVWIITTDGTDDIFHVGLDEDGPQETPS